MGESVPYMGIYLGTYNVGSAFIYAYKYLNIVGETYPYIARNIGDYNAIFTAMHGKELQAKIAEGRSL